MPGLGAAAGRRPGQERETEDNNVFQAWPRRVSIALAFAPILQVGFLAVWVTAAAPASRAYILMALSGKDRENIDSDLINRTKYP